MAENLVELNKNNTEIILFGRTVDSQMLINHLGPSKGNLRIK